MMAGIARVILAKKPRSAQDIKFRASVMMNEPYTGLRHILSFEDDADVVRATLSLARAVNDDRKVGLLSRKLESLMRKGKGG